MLKEVSCVLAVWLGLSGVAIAGSFETTTGAVELLPLGPIETDVLVIGDREVPIPFSAMAMEIVGQDGDLLLVKLASGGTACPLQWVFVDARHVPAQVSEVFGTCYDGGKVTVGPKGLELITPATRPDSTGDMRYWFEGGEVRSELGPSRTMGLLDVADWEGMDPRFIVNDPTWEGWFLKRVGPAGLLDLRALFDVSAPFAWDGDWLVGEGCKRDACGERRGVLMMHRSGERAAAAVSDVARKPETVVFGREDADALDAFIRLCRSDLGGCR